ncbi:MAG: hypothetical protein JRJ27_18790 [Deltaproteobacteria bacterium]|nr:hypothetical protein [Deltaproteobacteria bacterium]
MNLYLHNSLSSDFKPQKSPLIDPSEYLCRLAEAHSLIKIHEVKGKAAVPCGDKIHSIAIEKDETCRKLSASEIETNLKEILGVKVTLRALIYIEKRLGELNLEETQGKTLQQLFVKNRLLEFKTIFQEFFNIEPFVNAKDRIDVINSLNFAIFYELQGKRVVQEGLRVVLRWRKDRSIY